MRYVSDVEKNPLVSVIIPIYNAEKYLNQCLDSVLEQTYQNLEVICVNDGSNDGSYEIIDSFLKRDKRICVVNKDNDGVSKARNDGLKIASGKYICFVDSDDWLAPQIIDIAVNTAEACDAEMVFWSYLREFDNKCAPKRLFKESQIVFTGEDVQTKLRRRLFGAYGEDLKSPENSDAICTIWGKLYKRQSIINHHIEFVDIRKIGTFEDGIFNIDFLKHTNTAVYIDQYGYHYRKQEGKSLTGQFKASLNESFDNLFKILEEKIWDEKLPFEYTQALNNRKCLSSLGLGLNQLLNATSEWQHIQAIRKLITRPIYRDAYKEFPLRALPLHWRVFHICVKYRLSLATYFLLRVILYLIYN